MTLKEKYGGKALVAGASEGIGAAFAEYLASEGMDLILIARREGPLNRSGDDLEKRYGVNVKCIPCDLAEEDTQQALEKELAGMEIGIMVYNAAVSYIGPFMQDTPDNQTRAVQVNIAAPLRLVRHFGEKMLERRRGAIILMTSMAGLQGSGFLSLYAAGKAFSRVLAESLWYEWKSQGVDVIGCCAGATSTPGYTNSRPAKKNLFAPAVLRPDQLAAECFKRLGKQPSFITGRANRIASCFMHRIIPLKTAVNIMGDNIRKMYGIDDRMSR
ncbi:MAG: SDR family NAD(P)-dependent oxidoreductase [Bacteroidales bacterium]|nr:SDR family NAD(P)-dependent oxidoreductase [Bacteroidales bacterium]